MAFDNIEQRFSVVDLDYQGTTGALIDAGAALETTGWGEDLYPANDSATVALRPYIFNYYGRYRRRAG